MSGAFVPAFTVELASDLRSEMEGWAQSDRDDFIVMAYGLGASEVTRNLRHVGGTASWIAQGPFHFSCAADQPFRTITVTAGAPCLHTPGQCHSHPASPHYRSA